MLVTYCFLIIFYIHCLKNVKSHFENTSDLHGGENNNIGYLPRLCVIDVFVRKGSNII